MKVKNEELAAQLHLPSGYSGFSEKVNNVRDELLAFLKEAKSQGKKVAGYGAAAKGNTLLNFCNINAEDLEYVVDANPHKQNTFLPQSHIPVYAVDHIAKTKPDYVVILPWNLAPAVAEKMNHIRDWGGKFVTAVPNLKVF
jgi:hypothetical protein